MTDLNFTSAIGSRLDGSPLLVMLDVDGTLAPIAPTPDQAAIPRATLDTLARLVASPGVVVAFVSGRAAQDTWRMTGTAGAFVAGNHGVELRTPDGRIEVAPDVLRHESAIATAAATLSRDLAPISGAIVENKRWTLSVHYRLVGEADVRALKRRAIEVADDLGLRVMEGKKIVELRPPVDVDKGSAAQALLKRIGITPAAGAALYVGDDRTDEDAFHALRDVLPAAVTVRVVHGDEHVPTSARMTLDGTEQVTALLEWLAARRGAAAERLPR